MEPGTAENRQRAPMARAYYLRRSRLEAISKHRTSAIALGIRIPGSFPRAVRSALAVVEQPDEEAFDLPAPGIPPQWPLIPRVDTRL